ncbi:unnamed protein product [Durusdinium trenchii]|uniref:SET domain-containing protein n=1 Tax=Durusdinium trenchii TaxID=1381693 RepID=A0ABP0JIM6_9DINO
MAFARYMDATTEQQKLLGTLKLNSVKLSGGTGAGVFLTVSRANHSCYPNTRFYFEEEMCGLKVLRSIEEGEEITVSYLTDRSLLQPIAPRQTSLQTWQFRCQCQRCAAPSDDARAMRCRCGALRRATAEGWGRCPTCGADDQEMRRASSRWWLRYNACAPLAAEAELSSCWWRRGMHGRPSKVKSQGWMEEVVALYRELATTEGPRPDPSVHWMGASLAAFAAEAHLWRGEFAEAASAASARLHYVQRVVGDVDLAAVRWAKATRDVAQAMECERENPQDASRSPLQAEAGIMESELVAESSECRFYSAVQLTIIVPLLSYCVYFWNFRPFVEYAKAFLFHKLGSELWAPWLLSYEKELRTRHTLGAVPSAVPLPLRLLGSKLKRGSSAERSRSPDPGGFAGKPSQEAPVVGRPFWLGEPNSATPETTSHAHYGRSTSPKVRRGSVQPKMKNEGASGASNPLQLPSSRSPKPETEGREKEEAAQSSPSRFKHDNPKSLREQLAEETFLPASKIQPAGKPITFSPAVDVSIPQRTSERRVRPSKGSGTFPRSVSPPASFEAWR